MKLPRYNPEHIPWYIFTVVVLVVLLIWPWAANAARSHDITVNNYYEYPEPPAIQDVNYLDGGTVNNLSVTTGVSDSDLQQGLSAAMAGGSHQFDFSTTDYQLSISGVWEVSDEKESGYSFGFGKRWREHKYIPDALFHMSYTPNGSQDYVGAGVTFRIK